MIGLFKTEVIHRTGLWRSLEAVEIATLEWVDWFNTPPPAGIDPLPPGKVQLQLDFDYKGAAGELGKGATVKLSVNGTEVAEGEVPSTIPINISIGEGFDVGEDVGSAVDFTYTPPFSLTGGIDKVTVALR